jgi:hypothetical protein
LEAGKYGIPQTQELSLEIHRRALPLGAIQNAGGFRGYWGLVIAGIPCIEGGTALCRAEIYFKREDLSALPKPGQVGTVNAVKLADGKFGVKVAAPVAQNIEVTRKPSRAGALQNALGFGGYTYLINAEMACGDDVCAIEVYSKTRGVLPAAGQRKTLALIKLEDGKYGVVE